MGKKQKKTNKMNCELMLTYDTPALRQTGSRNLTGQNMLPTIWGPYMKLVIHIEYIYTFFVTFFLRNYRYPISWEAFLDPSDSYFLFADFVNIRFLPSIDAEKNATKNGHIQNVCSMCRKINKVGKQEVGI
jgi:hypothetical protein